MNPIEKAVAPLKSEAIDRAAKEAQTVIDRVRGELEKAGWDAQELAPYPSSIRDGHDEYHRKLSKYKLVNTLVISTDGGSRRINAPRPVKMDDDRCEKFVTMAKENAAFQYDAFVAKLNGKIGETKSAELTGNHVWGYSILTVETKAGETQRWKTQMIVNVSKLGKLFNQFPTRKMK